MKINEFIRKIRIDAGQTQTEFAAFLDISRSAITQLEAGNTKPSYEVLDLLVKIYGVDPADFFGYKKKPTKGEIITGDYRKKIQKLQDFYRRNYKFRFFPPLEDKVVLGFSEIAKDKEKKEAFLYLVDLYKELTTVIDRIQMDIIDSMKRQFVVTTKIKNKEFSEKELKDIEEKLSINIQLIFRDALLLKYEMEERFPMLLPSHEKNEQTEIKFTETSRKFNMLKFSQERYLFVFFYLLQHADDLEGVEEFYNIEHLWRE